MRIAVVGGGIAGMGAALLLQQRHEVTLYEAAPRLGGHSRTVEVEVEGRSVAVDTGFIIHNRKTYPLLARMFDNLEVATQPAPMSFGVHARDGSYSWSNDRPLSFFGQRRNLVRPSHWRLLGQIGGFFKAAKAWLAEMAEAGYDARREMSLGAWIAAQRLPAAVADNFLLPMCASIWSNSQERMLQMPAYALLSFFDNHQLLQFTGQHRWLSVVGGSQAYVAKLAQRLTGPVIHEAAASVSRGEQGASVATAAGGRREYDAVVLACHADQALRLLEDADATERELLGAVGFERNEAILHTDASLMPKQRGCWASWVSVICAAHDPVSINYWMNSLQQLPVKTPLIVSLNPPQPPAADKVLDRHEYWHPQFDGPALQAQQRFAEIQGRRGTWFCGAWLRNGFHEDGLWSAVQVAEGMGIKPPW
ncbi:MAG: FAD-dependent oxidoreductase [Betaproteobacteria bacterium AqS2]|uniref:FAD-dependent oxidoreductase n=1 Tax=Candidatus Amphirhobacter heronislandensis TaxID=1732024 RepID=A0A930UFN2_9GAMM|nr:FAD-dependent oxidoreductase [Betaproteobacteria bacterium AqS2]